MKNSKLALVMVLTALVVSLGLYRQGRLDAAAAVAPAKIGVVNVTQVLENNAKHKQWQEKMQKEQAAMKEEYDKMKNELEVDKAQLKLRTAGSEEALRLQSQILEKTALMQAKEDFYRGKVEAEMQKWTEALYKKTLTVVENVAKARGLDMVIADEVLDLPAPTLREFILTVKNKKLLYRNEQYDITAEVLAALDKTE